ncbi:MAG TPA: aminopeptidase [Verrucomicrobiae bacterium]|nr:aminopeptidase [Verrucomicrobiae bacterium]
MKRDTTSLNLRNVAILALLCAAVAGCHTRSISDSSYPGDKQGLFVGSGNRHGAYAYRGELNEFDVLGIARDQTVSEEQIASALNTAKPVRVAKGSSVLLIQSGARFPDDRMIQELSKYYNVTPFPGVPESKEGASYAKTLRLAAARGGNQAIICYWGILETAQQDLATKQLSWVPLVGWTLPDEKQHMRIRLKMAVIDVRSGDWAMLYPQPFMDIGASSIISRRNSDQRQVHALKDKAYATAAQQLVSAYAAN